MISTKGVIYNMVRLMHMLLKVRNPKMTFQGNWPGMLKDLERYQSRVKVIKVIWEFPPPVWVKYNTDDPSRENSGPSSFTFCIRNKEGDLIYAKEAKMKDTTNILTEATTMLEASMHCSQVGYDLVIFQTDFLLIQKVLIG